MLSTVWVLLMMTVYMGESAIEMLGQFPTEQQCLAALNTEAAKRGPLPHSQGGGSFYQCSSWQFKTR